MYSADLFRVCSPNQELTVTVKIGESLQYSIQQGEDVILEESFAAMKLTNGIEWKGSKMQLKKIKESSYTGTIKPDFYKKDEIENNYNELYLYFDSYDIVFRVFDDGVAYRFISNMKSDFHVEKEDVVLNLPSETKGYIPYVRIGEEAPSNETQFSTSFENLYQYIEIEEWEKDRLAFLPILLAVGNNKKICITECDLLNYPGLYLSNPDASNTLKGVFAPYPKELKQGGHNEIQKKVVSRESYIARCEGKTEFPWRVFAITNSDIELADNDIVYKLSSANKIKDTSWIKPGKVAWEWWNDWNLRGVPFEAGVNNDTYKYYIDFASKNNIEYVILDEGWAVNKQADLFKIVPQIDIPELVDYGKKKNVGIILWAGYYPFEKDMERVCEHYSKIGIKGFKLDFMNRDDQLMVDFHRRAAECAAKYNLLINFHGTYKPTGLQRTYPNVLNFEGVYGLEQLKFRGEQLDQVTYEVTIPFIRMLAGPMDYTPGAMRNSNRKNFRAVNSEPMSQGTRCRQLAMYVVYEAPLNMLADTPSNYMDEQESTDFIAGVPTTWNETIVLNGEVAKYITIARKKGEEWYIGSMTNWEERTLTIDLSFLEESGGYKLEILKDGKNAHKAANDYVREIIDMPLDRKITLTMAPGGGFAIRVFKI